MSVVLILIAVAALALCLLVWLLSRLRDDSRPSSFSKPVSAAEKPVAAVNSQAQPQASLSNKELPAQADKTPEVNKDVSFRMQGERGMGGPIFGDVMCADGVYLPHVWEGDLHTSYDGRWLRTGFYDSETAHLVDRKSRRSWLISKSDAEVLDAVHWRVPRWSGETLNESGIADDAHVVMSDASFEAWLAEHVDATAQPLVALRSLYPFRLALTTPAPSTLTMPTAKAPFG